MRVFIENGLEPARVGIFQNALPVRFAPEFRADRFDDLRMVEKRKERSSRAVLRITQMEGTSRDRFGLRARKRASRPSPERRKPQAPEHRKDRPAARQDVLFRRE